METGNLYIRLNYKVEGQKNDIYRHGAVISNRRNVCTSRYMVGGGIYNKNGGTIVFKAKDLNDAINIANNNPLKNNSKIKYEEVKRDLVIITK